MKFLDFDDVINGIRSLPLRERGLKWTEPAGLFQERDVAPLAGAWIEIAETARAQAERTRSLPLRERGLKSGSTVSSVVSDSVAPLAGAWIEISKSLIFSIHKIVAPLAGAWIEI